ncbi:MAG: peptidylprolyl isomerase [Micavibrio aeruginosavorus]|uniref:Peptidylprolyl isomerase n=1 Tax=Micavibrio aeruginosavorus TaxID=349221 RepID=A0A7T5R4S4_9BACT|nr:MAG: peptidylprolyl isomerase [Micavibrio aeruginosavorus]
MMSGKQTAPAVTDMAANAVQAEAPAAGDSTKAEAAAEPAQAEAPQDQAAADTPKVIGEGDSAIEVGNPVVAKIGDVQITRSEVLDFITTLPEQVRQMPLQNLFPMARDQVITNKLIADKAVKANLDSDPEVQKMLDTAKSQIVRGVYVDREIKAAVSEDDIKKAYDELSAELSKVEETRARHILVDSEEKAREVIGKLEGGAKFEDLVKEYSSDPNKSNDGDLGYFAKADMVPEFAEAAFALGVGQYTKDPVKTQFGFHVIKAEDRRARPAPKFEDVRPQLESAVRQRKLVEMIKAWQVEAKVERFDINGKTEAAVAPAPVEEKKQ